MTAKFVELVEDRVMFSLDELVYVAEMHANERSRSTEKCKTRVALKTGADLTVTAEYAQVAAAVALALGVRR